jgi:hypothetical protein
MDADYKETTMNLYYFDPSKLDMAELAYASKDADRLDIIMDALVSPCRCGYCVPHTSDCAVHDSESRGRCDCPTRG